MLLRTNRLRALSAIVFVLLFGSLLLTGCGQSSTDSKKETGDKPATEQKQSSGDKNASSSYPSKDITYIVPTSPGGGFDTFSRILAPFLQKYLPNNPNVVVKNVTGAGWLIGVQEIARSKPDGYTIGIFNSGNILMQLTGEDFDMTKQTWIGQLTEQKYVGALSAKSKLKSFDDIKKAGKVKAGIVSLKAADGINALIFLTEAGIKPEFVTHKGTSEAALSGVRGDVDYNQAPVQTVMKFVPTKDMVPVVVFASERIKALPDVPTIKELGYEQFADLVKVSYLVGGPPGIPDDVAKTLRDAFDKAVSDPEFLEKLEKAQNDKPVPGNHEVAASTVNKLFENYSKYKELIIANSK